MSEQVDIVDIEEEILVFLKGFVKKKIDERIFPYEVTPKITKENEIEVMIRDPIFNVEDILMLKSLEKLFKIKYFEFIPDREPDTRYLIMLMKPKKNAIKLAMANLRIL
jgi:hypothetical protein